jgi:hypothetical protein
VGVELVKNYWAWDKVVEDWRKLFKEIEEANGPGTN